jgi:putative acetyltransferase
LADAAAPDHDARCPRCGAAFHCGARDVRCDCAQVALDAATLSRLRSAFGTDCLCMACLRSLEALPANLPGQAALRIRVDDLRGPDIQALLEEHLAHMRSISPPESVHALDLDALRQPWITFWTAWSGAHLLGCGALKEIDAGHGEIKSMRTAAAHRRGGVARAMLGHIIAEARRRGYARLSLETGSEPPFAPARRLYASFGFADCPPFEGYAEDPNSVFMTKTL